MISQGAIKENNTGKRILIIGLGGVGKTSIGLLMKTMNKEIAEKTVPSISIEKYDRKFAGRKVSLFVTPGQKRFLFSLFRRVSKKSMLIELLERADVIIYVVDSSDYNRFPEMFEYFKILVEKIADIVSKNGVVKKLILLAHKQDLPNALSEKVVEEYFVKPLEPILKRYGINVEVFGTTIYKPITLLRVLYSIMAEELENYESIVKKIGVKFSAEAVFLGDSEGILIANYGDSELSWNLLLFFLKLKKIIEEVPTYVQTIVNPNRQIEVLFHSKNKVLLILNIPIAGEDDYSIVLGIVNPQVRLDFLLSEIKKIVVKLALNRR